MDTKRATLQVEDFLALGAILLLPWAFGGVEIWAYRGAAFMLVLAASIALWRQGYRALGVRLRSERWLAPAFLLAAWAALQLVPLPAPVVEILSPEAHRIRADALPGYPAEISDPFLPALEGRAILAVPEVGAQAERWRAPGGTQGSRQDERLRRYCRSGWKPISLHPTLTAERLCWYLALLAAFLYVRQRAALPSVARVYRWAFFALFLGLALFALLQQQTWAGKLYGVRPILVDSVPMGPYVNANHFAGAMELAVPWLVGYAWSRHARDRKARARFVWLIAALCCIAGLASGSKAAVVLLPSSLIALGLLGSRTPRARLKVAGAATVLVAIVFAGVALTGVGAEIRSFVERSEGLDVPDARWSSWRAAGRMIADFPMTGGGIGSFRELFPRYAPAGHTRRWAQLHNDYLELLAEGGVVAALLFAWLVWGYGTRGARRLRPSGRRLSRSRLGLTVGLCALALHAVIDFNHQIPANALLFVSMAALALPLPRHAFRDRPKGGRATRVAGAAMILLLCVWFGARAFEGGVSGLAFARGAVAAAEGREAEATRRMKFASAGGNRLPALKRMADLRRRRWDERARQDGPVAAGWPLLEQAASDLGSCLCLSPAGVRPYEGLGRVYERMEMLRRAEGGGQSPPESAAGWSDLGRHGAISVGMQRLAAKRATGWYLPHDRLALALWEFGQEADALEAVRRSASVLPRYGAHRYKRRADLPDAFVQEFLSAAWDALERAGSDARGSDWVALADMELSRGRPERALRAAREALAVKTDAKVRAAAAIKLGRAHLALGEFEEARTAFESATGHPGYEDQALLGLAQLARETGQADQALRYLGRLQRTAPWDLNRALAYAAAARQAGRSDAALATLRWAAATHPGDPRPKVVLIEILIEQGNLGAADAALRELESRTGSSKAVRRLQQALETAEQEPDEPDDGFAMSGSSSQVTDP